MNLKVVGLSRRVFLYVIPASEYPVCNNAIVKDPIKKVRLISKQPTNSVPISMPFLTI
jgi:hypothetical protein